LSVGNSPKIGWNMAKVDGHNYLGFY
jgi:hypothetical protein